MKRAILLIGLWLCATPTFAEVQADVQKATQSVYRIWLGIPLPNGFVKQLDGSYIQAMQTQNFTEQVPLKGMILLDKKSGKTKELWYFVPIRCAQLFVGGKRIGVCGVGQRRFGYQCAFC